MQNTVITGTGDSRSIKAAPTIPFSWEEARAQLISIGWLIDLGALRPDGCSVIGTSLGKESLLTDATEAYLWGWAANRTPNDAFWQLKALVDAALNTADGKAKIETGTFTPASREHTVYFSFAPKLYIQGVSLTNGTTNILIWTSGTIKGFGFIIRSSGATDSMFSNVTANGNELYFSSDGSVSLGSLHTYLAIA